jgi:hypothetical protein
LSTACIPRQRPSSWRWTTFNTHAPSSLYKAFPPEEARRILRKLELHYTPKHGGWLNTAGIELNVMTRQCLSRRLGSLAQVSAELDCWKRERKQQSSGNSLRGMHG